MGDIYRWKRFTVATNHRVDFPAALSKMQQEKQCAAARLRLYRPKCPNSRQDGYRSCNKHGLFWRGGCNTKQRREADPCLKITLRQHIRPQCQILHLVRINAQHTSTNISYHRSDTRLQGCWTWVPAKHWKLKHDLIRLFIYRGSTSVCMKALWLIVCVPGPDSSHQPDLFPSICAVEWSELPPSGPDLY